VTNIPNKTVNRRQRGYLLYNYLIWWRRKRIKFCRM